MMSRVLVFLLAAALIFGAVTNRMGQVSQATISGAQEAVRLLLSIGGSLCLWSGLMEVMDRSGLSRGVARLLQPLIRFLFREDATDKEAKAALSQNMSANLLGLGSAATPAGLRAAARLHTLARQQGRGDDAVFLLIVLNTASLQLLPTTVAAVRASYGARSPYDILPAVWLASAVSVAVGVLAARLMRRWCR
ncbi:MAG: spore maturation protein A [Clostridia bacterium]|nr:spore maturation protein A [Clostridia bacterium]